MAWNKPAPLSHDLSSKGKNHKRPYRWIYGGFSLIAIPAISLLIWAICEDETEFEAGSGKRASHPGIPTVKQSAKPKSAIVESVSLSNIINTTDRNDKVGLWTNEQGVVFFNGKKLAYSRRVNRPKEPYEIFSFDSENQIAELITTEPGTAFFGKPNYTKRFREDFMKSCEVPIIASDDDSDYDKALKRSMIETKIEIRNRMANGEDIGDILTEARNELQKLGAIKMDIQRLVREQAAHAGDEKGVDDLIAAANVMLEKKGIAPLKFNPIIRNSLVRKAIMHQEGEEK